MYCKGPKGNCRQCGDDSYWEEDMCSTCSVRMEVEKDREGIEEMRSSSPISETEAQMKVEELKKFYL